MRGRIAAAVLLMSVNASATTIVALWTPDRLVISGDSLLSMTWTSETGQRRHKSATACKIRQFGSNYISAAGNYHIQTADFDVWESAIRACGSNMTVDRCAARLTTELRGTLAHIVSGHDVHLSVIVAGRQNGAPALNQITFAGTPQGRLSVQTQSFRKGIQTWGRVILGDRAAIDRSVGSAPSSQNLSLQDQALSLVRLEAKAAPQDVGAPFSTLTIDAAGERWLNPGCCPAACSK